MHLKRGTSGLRRADPISVSLFLKRFHVARCKPYLVEKMNETRGQDAARL